MCGRFVRRHDGAGYQSHFDIDALPEFELRSSFNVAPSASVLAVRSGESGQRQWAALRWGLVPVWSKGPDNRYTMINARAETIADKPAYRNGWRQRRCLIVADGFYEWRREAGKKQPFFIRLAGGEPVAFGGLWERWESRTENSVIESCTIVTTTANPLVATIHDRMPVIVAPEDYARWLRSESQTPPSELLRPYPAELMDAYPVALTVNNARNDSPSLVEPIADECKN